MIERRAGFTLIELVVAVAILGLSMTIVFLKVDTLLPGSRLKAACKKIVTDLEHLRSQAIFSGVPIYLEYHIDTESYRAYFPVVFDEENKVVGAGETEIFEPMPVGETIAIEIWEGIQDEEVKALPYGLGKIDQYVDSTDVLSNSGRCRRLSALYEE